jgi:addiction module RelE/StbE family toxin
MDIDHGLAEYDVSLAPSADGDLDEIFNYIAVQLVEPETASHLIERLYEAIASLSFMPLRCPLSRDAFLAKQGYRVLPVENYIVFFVVGEPEKAVIVHRVLYGKRNYAALF